MTTPHDSAPRALIRGLTLRETIATVSIATLLAMAMRLTVGPFIAAAVFALSYGAGMAYANRDVVRDPTVKRRAWRAIARITGMIAALILLAEFLLDFLARRGPQP